MKKNVLAMLAALISAVSLFTACSSDKKPDDADDKVMSSEADSDLEEVTEADTTEEEITEIVTAEAVTTEKVTQTEPPEATAEPADIQSYSDGFVTFNGFEFPVDDRMTDDGSNYFSMEFVSDDENNVLSVTYYSDSLDETIDILQTIADESNGTLRRNMNFNGLYGCLLSLKSDDIVQVCALVTSSVSSECDSNTPFVLAEVNGYDLTEATDILNVTLDGIRYNADHVPADVGYGDDTFDEGFDCPYFTVYPDNKWKIGSVDYKTDSDVYDVVFEYADDYSCVSFTADDNPGRMTVNETANDYLDQSCDGKKSVKTEFMGYDAVEVTVKNDDFNCMKYIIFDTGDALITVWSNIHKDNYDTINQQAEEFIQTLILK